MFSPPLLSSSAARLTSSLTASLSSSLGGVDGRTRLLSGEMSVGMVGSGVKDDASGVLVLGVAAVDCGGVLEVDWAVRLGEELEEEGGRLIGCVLVSRAMETGGVGVLNWVDGGIAAAAVVMVDLPVCFGSLIQAPIASKWTEDRTATAGWIKRMSRAATDRQMKTSTGLLNCAVSLTLRWHASPSEDDVEQTTRRCNAVAGAQERRGSLLTSELAAAWPTDTRHDRQQ